MTPQNIANIIYVVLLIAAFACEQFHVVPAGTANVVMALVTGHAVGTNTPVLSNTSNVQGNVEAPQATTGPSTPEKG